MLLGPPTAFSIVKLREDQSGGGEGGKEGGGGGGGGGWGRWMDGGTE